MNIKNPFFSCVLQCSCVRLVSVTPTTTPARSTVHHGRHQEGSEVPPREALRLRCLRPRRQIHNMARRLSIQRKSNIHLLIPPQSKRHLHPRLTPWIVIDIPPIPSPIPQPRPNHPHDCPRNHAGQTLRGGIRLPPKQQHHRHIPPSHNLRRHPHQRRSHHRPGNKPPVHLP